MPDQLQNLLEDVCDNVEDARDTLVRSQGLLGTEDIGLVGEHIDTALERISRVLDELDDVGADTEAATIESIDTMADECVQLAKRALASHETGSATPERIGGAMKTIRRFMTDPNGLRQRFGV